MDFLNDMQDKLMELAVIEQLEEGGIDAVIKMANELGKKEPDFSNVKDKEYLNFIHPIVSKSSVYSKTVTKKVMGENKKDFIKLGEEIKKIGDEMIAYGLLHKDDKTNDKKEDKKEKKNSKQLFEEFIDSIFEDLD